MCVNFILVVLPPLLSFLLFNVPTVTFGFFFFLGPLGVVYRRVTYVACLLSLTSVMSVQKKSMESINSRLQLVMKSGKYVLGYKQSQKMIRQGKAKLVILANNCPALRFVKRMIAFILFLWFLSKPANRKPTSLCG